MQPLFSIVMPTRNRARTFEYALQTALCQDFDDYEIVVSDNCSTDNTAGMVKDLGNSRTRYVRTPEPLHMCGNFDFALAQSRGTYTIVLSDDDGLLRNALSDLAGVIRETKVKVVQWHRAQYNWPAYLVGNLKNHLIYTRPRYHGQIVPSKKILSDAIRLLSSNDTPGLVNSAVHADVFAALRSRTGGKAIVAHAADVSSGLVIPCVVDEIYMLEKVIGIAGLSEFSTGVSLHTQDERNQIAQEFIRQTKISSNFTTAFVERNGFSTVSCLLDALHDAARYFPEAIHLNKIDHVKAIAQSLYEVSMFATSDVRRKLRKRLWRMVYRSYGGAAGVRFALLLLKGRVVEAVNTDAMKPVSSLLRVMLGKPYGSRELYAGVDHGFSDVKGACDFLHQHLSHSKAAMACAHAESAR